MEKRQNLEKRFDQKRELVAEPAVIDQPYQVMAFAFQNFQFFGAGIKEILGTGGGLNGLEFQSDKGLVFFFEHHAGFSALLGNESRSEIFILEGDPL